MRTVTRLPNSLRIVTDEMNELDTVALGAWVGIGSMFEPAEINGISHLLEHMVFKGTTTRSARQIAEEIENEFLHVARNDVVLYQSFERGLASCRRYSGGYFASFDVRARRIRP